MTGLDAQRCLRWAGSKDRCGIRCWKKRRGRENSSCQGKVFSKQTNCSGNVYADCPDGQARAVARKHAHRSNLFLASCFVTYSYRDFISARAPRLREKSLTLLGNFGFFLGMAEGFEVRPDVLDAFFIESLDHRLFALRG